MIEFIIFSKYLRHFIIHFVFFLSSMITLSFSLSPDLLFRYLSLSFYLSTSPSVSLCFSFIFYSPVMLFRCFLSYIFSLLHYIFFFPTSSLSFSISINLYINVSLSLSLYLPFTFSLFPFYFVIVIVFSPKYN